MLNKTLFLEIDKPNYVPIYTVQYDYNSRFYEITILNNSQPLDLTGIRVIVAGKKPDGKEVFNSCKVLDAKKGLIQLELTEQMNAVNGASEYALELFSADGMLSSQPFELIVTRSTISKSVESSKELGALKDALNEVQDIDNRFAQTNAQLSESKNELNSRINSIIALPDGSTTADAELIDIRVDTEGNIGKSAGETVRSLETLVKSVFKYNKIVEDSVTIQSKSIYFNFKTGRYYKFEIYCSSTYSINLKINSDLNTIIENKTGNTLGFYFLCDNDYTEIVTYSNPASNLQIIVYELSIDNTKIDILNQLSEESIKAMENNKALLTSLTLIDHDFLQSSNTLPCELKKGVEYKLSVKNNSILYSLSLLPNYPDVTGYNQIIPNTTNGKEDFILIPDRDYNGIMVWNSSPSTGSISVAIKRDYIDSKYILNNDDDNKEENSLSGVKIATFGDSITSDDVTGIGTRVSEILGTTLVGNFAIGACTCSDFKNGSENITTISLDRPKNSYANVNVLSNQVRRMLQYTTAKSQQITWKHKLSGTFNLDTNIGVGLGNITSDPNIIYIAIGTNDGIDSKTSVEDDTEIVLSQSYSELTRISLASALRWSIETLQCAYPKAKIFVASPLQTSRTTGNFSYQANLQKRNIIEKVCRYCSVFFIDSFSESGYSTFRANDNGDGIHPGADWKEYISKYVANEIKNKYVK